MGDVNSPPPPPRLGLKNIPTYFEMPYYTETHSEPIKHLKWRVLQKQLTAFSR